MSTRGLLPLHSAEREWNKVIGATRRWRDQHGWSVEAAVTHTLRVTQPNAACSWASPWTKERKLQRDLKGGLSGWGRHRFPPRFEPSAVRSRLNQQGGNDPSCTGFPTDYPAETNGWRESSRQHRGSSEETTKDQQPREEDHISNTVTTWRFSLTSNKITSRSRMRSWPSLVKADLGLKGSVCNDTACVSTQMSLAGLRRSPLVSVLRPTLVGMGGGGNGPENWVKLHTTFKCSGGSQVSHKWCGWAQPPYPGNICCSTAETRIAPASQ